MPVGNWIKEIPKDSNLFLFQSKLAGDIRPVICAFLKQEVELLEIVNPHLLIQANTYFSMHPKEDRDIGKCMYKGINSVRL